MLYYSFSKKKDKYLSKLKYVQRNCSAKSLVSLATPGKVRLQVVF